MKLGLSDNEDDESDDDEIEAGNLVLHQLPVEDGSAEPQGQAEE
jgi:hypothetical protein